MFVYLNKIYTTVLAYTAEKNNKTAYKLVIYHNSATFRPSGGGHVRPPSLELLPCIMVWAKCFVLSK